ncbi:MAG: hypothetical protein EKK63_02605 [Acinetobacter sp.]|uniref:hypothetical protein n=1 Tax=Acinetobacter sp. TaxID=472 RepID=UPI000FA64923|nr:hypothetical protein [Acinetobacter sp.]RUP42208.1 MAG: hypothetical protein EKK63_02605 [Acinetobacter sp.]
MFITVNKVNDRITGQVNGQPYHCTYTAEKFAAMKELAESSYDIASMQEMKALIESFLPYTKESYKEIIESKTPHLFVNPVTNEFFLKLKNGKKSSIPLPTPFATRIMKAVDEGLSVEPLLKAWARFLCPIPGRPAYTQERGHLFAEYISAPYISKTEVNRLMLEEKLSEEVALSLATTTQVAITKEGFLNCYKVSKEVTDRYALDDKEEVVKKSVLIKKVDAETGLVSYEDPLQYAEDRLFEPAVMGQSGDAFVCSSLGGNLKEGHIIKVGHVHYLKDWSQVSIPGQKGLHCGGLSYIEGYQREGTVTHNILVNPADIHSISMCSDGAMTVKQYFVHSTFNGVNKTLYTSSSYQEFTDAQYQEILAAAISVQEEALTEMEEAKNLI